MQVVVDLDQENCRCSEVQGLENSQNKVAIQTLTLVKIPAFLNICQFDDKAIIVALNFNLFLRIAVLF